MAKLHELLAVESNLRSQAEVTRNDLMNTFDKKRTHFTEIRQAYQPKKEGEQATAEVKQSIQTSVDKELDWVGEKLAKVFDVGFQIDIANTAAKADIVLEDGSIFMTGIPATYLLQVEKRLAELHAFVQTIPTLDPAKGFELDKSMEPGTFKARDVTRDKTEKVFWFQVMVQATDKHPAQIEKNYIDQSVGTVTISEWSTFITVARKGEMLDRLENLIRAVKQARSRANDMEVDVKGNKVGAKILDFVFNGK